MLSFFDMENNYEERVVDNYEGKGELVVDTAAVTDSEQDYETGISHPKYNDGKWVIIELYDTKDEAQVGHDKWVKIMTAATLPEQIEDVSTAEIKKLASILEGEG